MSVCYFQTDSGPQMHYFGVNIGTTIIIAEFNETLEILRFAPQIDCPRLMAEGRGKRLVPSTNLDRDEILGESNKAVTAKIKEYLAYLRDIDKRTPTFRTR